MLEVIDRRKDGYYTLRNIFEEAVEKFHIDYDVNDKGKISNILRKISRDLEDIDNPIKFVNEKPIIVSKEEREKDKLNKSKQGNDTFREPYYYSRQVVEVELDNLYHYFNKSNDAREENHHVDSMPDYMIIKDNLSELQAEDKELQKKLNTAGLTQEQYQALILDMASGANDYVTLDELIYLGLTGIVDREDLNDEQTKDLQIFRKRQAELIYEEERIEQLYQQKKLEVMITALFNEKYTLDEKKLYEDVANFVRRGKDVEGIVRYNKEKDEMEYLSAYSNNIKKYRLDGSLDISLRRSYLRLQDAHSYCIKKDNNKDIKQ